jgi:hypothetical protein
VGRREPRPVEDLEQRVIGERGVRELPPAKVVCIASWISIVASSLACASWVAPDSE